MTRSGRTRNPVAVEWLVLIAFVCVMSLFILPGRDCFQFDHDEGVNLARSQLVAQGHLLYTDVWSDQPPLFTLLQAGAFRLFGFSVSAGRAVVLAFSAVLLCAAWDFMRLAAGRTHGILAVLLILQLSHFARLSISSMVGLPMLALSLVALALLARWHRSRDIRWLLLSAVAMGLSVLTKLQSGFLVPIILTGLLVQEWHAPSPRAWFRRLAPAIGWGAVFGVTTLVLLGGLVGAGSLHQLLEGHLQARGVDVFHRYSLLLALDRSQAILLAVPALLGAALFIRRRRWLGLYPVAWLAAAGLSLFNHAPVWYHHALLVTVPAAMLAAHAAGEVLRWATPWRASLSPLSPRGAVAATVAGCLCLSAAEQVARGARAVWRWPDSCAAYAMAPPDGPLLARMKELAPRAAWCVTDVPMYAMRAGLAVPPEIAVLTTKRLRTGQYTEQDMLEQIARLAPDLIYLARFEWPAVQASLDADVRYRHDPAAQAGAFYVRAE